MPQLAQLLRGKYPGSYDDLSDEELEASVTAKFPGVYDDLVDPVARPAAPVSPTERRGMSLQDKLASYDQQNAQATETVRGVGTWIKDNPGATGAMAAGVVAAPFTGAMSIPAVMATMGGSAAVGGFLGDLAGQAGQMSKPDAKQTELNYAQAAQQGLWEGAIGAPLAGIGPVIGNTGRAMYRSALKTAGKTPKQIAELVETGIDEGINVSEAGWTKADEKVKGITASVRKLIQDLAPKGAKVDLEHALGKINQVRDKFQAKFHGPEDYAVLDKLEEFYRSQYPSKLSPMVAHEGKTGLAEQAAKGGIYEQTLNPAGAEAKGAVASGFREQLEALVPEIAAPNARSSRLIGVRDAMGIKAQETPFHPGAAMSMMYGGPAAAAVQVGMRAPALSAAGRRVAKAGDFFDVRKYAPARTAAVAATPDAPPPTTLDQLGIPEVPGPAYQRNALDSLDIPATREMYSPEELWIKKFLEEQNPQLKHLPFEKMQQLIRQSASQGTYGTSAVGQPAVKNVTPLAKSDVDALYQRYKAGK